jgi:hypothetical protein
MLLTLGVETGYDRAEAGGCAYTSVIWLRYSAEAVVLGWSGYSIRGPQNANEFAEEFPIMHREGC